MSVNSRLKTVQFLGRADQLAQPRDQLNMAQLKPVRPARGRDTKSARRAGRAAPMALRTSVYFSSRQRIDIQTTRSIQNRAGSQRSERAHFLLV